MHLEPPISLRPYRVEDAPAVLEAALSSVAEIRPFLPWCDPDRTLEEVRAWLEAQVQAFEAGTAFEFAILAEDGSYLGSCALNQIESANRRANLGYWVCTSATRRGVATAAIRQIVRWAFENTDLIRLEVIVSTKNVASLRTAEKAGAVREGVLRKRLLLHGVAHDAVVFSFIREASSARNLPLPRTV
ncbi:MAG TPA: GNAT family N-acetyltransferase [Thermoanaerobaculia bacterium]|nr:GNAT family N-acetyltransferase [Thermoanaerobaculia bacterium]